MFYKPTIEDSRGHRIDLHSGLSLSAVREMLNREERKAFNEVMKEDFFGNKKKRYPKVSLAISIIGFGVIFFAISKVISNPPSLGGMNTTSILIGAGIGAIITAGFFLGNYTRMKTLNADRPYARVVMNMKRCPGCLYSLEELQPEPDGCTVCPECGGAWKLP